MDYSPSMLRGTRAHDGLLCIWGDAVAHGHFPAHRPADPDRPRLAAHFGPRSPSPDFLPDLARAYATLPPRHAQVIALYYVAGLGHADHRRALAAMPPHARDTWLDQLAHLARTDPTAPALDDADGDALVARCIPKVRGPGTIGPSAANKLRNEAIVAMATHLGWQPRPATPID